MFLKTKALLSKIVPLLDYTKTAYTFVAPPDYSCTTGTTLKEACNFTLPAKGVYLVKVQLQFQSNGTGNRALEVSKTSGGYAAALTMKDMRTNTGGSYTTPQCTFLYAVNGASEKLYVNCWQNSGATLTVAPRIQYVRLR